MKTLEEFKQDSTNVELTDDGLTMSIDAFLSNNMASYTKIVKDLCPFCKCTKIRHTVWTDGEHIDEELYECSECGAKKYHGYYGVTEYENWKHFTEDDNQNTINTPLNVSADVVDYDTLFDDLPF